MEVKKCNPSQRTEKTLIRFENKEIISSKSKKKSERQLFVSSETLYKRKLATLLSESGTRKFAHYISWDTNFGFQNLWHFIQ